VAIVSGSVTVAALGVQGWLNRGAEKRRNEREDRQRAEDRAWSVRQDNLAERRALYANLLRAARDVTDVLQSFLSTEFNESASADEHQEAMIQARAHLEAFAKVASDADVAAVDRSVITALQQFDQGGWAVMGEVMFGPMVHEGASREEARRAVALSHRRLSGTLVPALRDACRRDLGVDADTP
jgi:hypothetical protein